MAIPTFDGPKEGNFATFEFLPLNGHLRFFKPPHDLPPLIF